MDRIILGIETSCDDTGVAVSSNGKILSNVVISQSVHKQYGGVVPELAARHHAKNILPAFISALQQAQVSKNNLVGIGFTQGPGLLGPLLVGSAFAKSLAFALDIPLIAVHHMKAHVLANFIDDPKPDFPFLCLNVSGGHTQLVLAHNPLHMQLLGTTKDDAMGEALDKIGKYMGLDYPAAPLIDQYSQYGDPKKFSFPKTDMPNLDFSFSGCKTAFLYFIQKELKKDPNFIKTHLYDLCASIQDHIIEGVLDKCAKAAQQTQVKNIGLAGGVAANSVLRKKLQHLGKQKGWNIHIPNRLYCTDNAAMIALSADYQYLHHDFCTLSLSPQPKISL